MPGAHLLLLNKCQVLKPIAAYDTDKDDAGGNADEDENLLTSHTLGKDLDWHHA